MTCAVCRLFASMGLLIKEIPVQVSDTTMPHSTTTAGYKKYNNE